MPVSSGLRSRPQIGRTRRLARQRLVAGALAQLFPRALIIPVMFAGAVTAATAATWTYGEHVGDIFADSDAEMTTGGVDPAN